MRRATSLTDAPGANASATIARFCSSLHRRRRSRPDITSTRLIAPSFAPVQITSLAPVPPEAASIPRAQGGRYRTVTAMLTFLAVLVAQVFFRANSTGSALSMLAGMIGPMEWRKPCHFGFNRAAAGRRGGVFAGPWDGQHRASGEGQAPSEDRRALCRRLDDAEYSANPGTLFDVSRRRGEG